MDHTHQDAAVRIEPRTIDAPSTQVRSYTTQQLAEEFDVKTTTIGSWASRWLSQVAPETLLKEGKGTYTELAHTLLQEFARVDERERPAWVADAKQRYAAEWGSAGIIACEVMPNEVSSTLALMQTSNTSQQAAFALQLSEVESLIDSLNTADADFSTAELESFKIAGAQRAIKRFQIEAVTEAQTYEALRQKRLQRGEQA